MSTKLDGRNTPELFRDRGIINPMPEQVELESPAAVTANQVNAALVKEVLLGSIGNLRAKVQSGRFSQFDAGTLEKLLDLVKDWPALAKAVDDLQAWQPSAGASVTDLTEARPATRQTVRALRAVLAATGEIKK